MDVKRVVGVSVKRAIQRGVGVSVGIKRCGCGNKESRGGRCKYGCKRGGMRVNRCSERRVDKRGERRRDWCGERRRGA